MRDVRRRIYCLLLFRSCRHFAEISEQTAGEITVDSSKGNLDVSGLPLLDEDVEILAYVRVDVVILAHRSAVH